MAEKMIAYCGIECTGCRAFIATQKNDKKLREEVVKAWSTEKEPLKSEDINCDGCLTTGQRLFKFCEVCRVRLCGREKGVKNCAHCREFPCEKLTGFWKRFKLTEPKATLEGIRKKPRA